MAAQRSFALDASARSALAGRILIEQSDLVISLGYDMVEYHPRLWNPDRNKEIVHIDFLAAEIDAHYHPATEVVGDVAALADCGLEGGIAAGEPGGADVFYLASDVTLGRGGRYLVTLGTSMSARLKLMSHPERLIMLCRMDEGDVSVNELVDLTSFRKRGGGAP